MLFSVHNVANTKTCSSLYKADSVLELHTCGCSDNCTTSDLQYSIPIKRVDVVTQKSELHIIVRSPFENALADIKSTVMHMKWLFIVNLLFRI